MSSMKTVFKNLFSSSHFFRPPLDIPSLEFWRKLFLSSISRHSTWSQHSTVCNFVDILDTPSLISSFYLISLDISSMTERSCWYFVWLAGSRAPLVAGSCEREGAPGPVGVEDCGGLVRERSEAERPAEARDWAVGVPALPEYSLALPPLTLVRLVPAAASSCCCAGVRPDTPPPPPKLSRPLLKKCTDYDAAWCTPGRPNKFAIINLRRNSHNLLWRKIIFVWIITLFLRILPKIDNC